MRNRSSRIRRTAAVGGVLAVVLGTGMTGVATATATAAEGSTAVVPCPRGFVCMSEAPNGAGRTYRLAQASSVFFASPVAVSEVTNSTTVDYCVTGTPSYVLRPGQTQTGPNQVRSLSPRPTGGACPF
ncbi:hypothetical protein [Streptomyces torulosus]|uniref:hypothetical protein n=1 Tax=Streptomyces torulosus TaxID=68276 RepID=UPI00099EAED1|nr:hypothetical protein [Streptomyces torulosus]